MSTTEIFNADTVKGTISDVEGQFSELSSIIETINGKVAEALGSPDRAMYGDAASRVLATWDENCSMLNEFMNIFDSWSGMVTSIGTEYGLLESGTATVKDTDKQYFQDIANANRSTYLQTAAAREAYKGSESTYTDKDGIEHTITKNLTDGMVHTYKDSDGKEIIDYSTLAGTQIGSKIDGKLIQDGKVVNELLTDEQKENNKKVSEAQNNLKDSLKEREEERKKRAEARKSEYKNPGNLSGYQLDFINEIKNGAIEAYEKYGVLPSLTLAQAILETGWGQHRIGNNIFGIKAGSNWTGKVQNCRTSEQNSDGSYYTVYSDFRDYDSVEDSIIDHAELLTMDRYKPVLASTNYQEACTRVRECGYATSLNYSSNLISLVEQYGLNQWDPK